MEQAKKREIINSVLDAVEEATKKLPGIGFTVNYTSSIESLYVHMYRVNSSNDVKGMKLKLMYFDWKDAEQKAKEILDWLGGLENEQEVV